MNERDLILFLLQIAMMLAVALVFGQIARRMGFPSLLGELIGGVILGPTVFGAFFKPAYETVFLSSAPASLAREAIIKAGMLFFLFVAGLEIDLGHLKKRGLAAAWTSFLGIILPFSAGVALVFVWPSLLEGHYQGNKLVAALFLGTALSITALPVIARILMDLKLLRTEFGTVVMTSATIDDLAGWTLFALTLSYFHTGNFENHSILFTLGVIAASLVVIVVLRRGTGGHPLKWLEAHLPRPAGFISATAVIVLLAAAFAEWAGAHAVFGAFLAGVIMASDQEEWDEAHETISQFVISFFAPVYFVSIGLRADFAAHFDGVLVLTVFAVACAGKIIGAALGGYLGKMSGREAWALGFAMNARGAMEMILASVALEAGLIDEKLFIALVIMALATSIISAPAIKAIYGAQDRKNA
jgi:Kef-type K+ transport system membrane component KefB